MMTTSSVGGIPGRAGFFQNDRATVLFVAGGKNQTDASGGNAANPQRWADWQGFLPSDSIR
jgi:hypothetical protein